MQPLELRGLGGPFPLLFSVFRIIQLFCVDLCCWGNEPIGFILSGVRPIRAWSSVCSLSACSPGVVGTTGLCCPSATALPLSRRSVRPPSPRAGAQGGPAAPGQGHGGVGARGAPRGHVRRALGVTVTAPGFPSPGGAQMALSAPLRPRLPRPSGALELGGAPPSGSRGPRLASPGPVIGDR